MNLTWSARLIKHLLFAFNLLFVITGIVILGVGVSVKAYYYEYETFLDDKYFSLPNLLIATGVIIFIISFFGCYGAYKSNWFLIFVFSCLLIIIFIFEFAAGIAGYVLRDKTAAYLEDTLLKSQSKYGNDTAVTNMWDLIQNNFECCGTRNYSDWEAKFKNQSLPLSCCHSTNGVIDAFYCNSNTTIVPYISTTSATLPTAASNPSRMIVKRQAPAPPVPVAPEGDPSDGTVSSSTESSSSPAPTIPSKDESTYITYKPSTTLPYSVGCEDAFGDFIRSHAINLGAVGITLCVLQLLGIAFSCYLCRKLKHSYYST